MLRNMEKFRIAQYGLIQVAAIIYGMLSCGAIVKAGKLTLDVGRAVPDVYYFAFYFREYGLLSFMLVVAWTVYCAFKSSSLAHRPIDERHIVISGLVLSALFFIASTIFLIGVLVVTFPPSS
jgi:hypothetical protein